MLKTICACTVQKINIHLLTQPLSTLSNILFHTVNAYISYEENVLQISLRKCEFGIIKKHATMQMQKTRQIYFQVIMKNHESVQMQKHGGTATRLSQRDNQKHVALHMER